ncbi:MULTISPECIES: TIGR02594 family protein [unclassified Bradyrhizobium]|uniref:TIGR02594 family protein n=1 Tax=unclassified Bradyrhizobium TaxID=2631580 RepID=UPI0024786C1B|nr:MULTISPECIES: TIGR02594 family protein [unclassified Bradyrhizobium]WGR72272.1 TIGR02594 family protein [Bradyrhizobium sp. ISRA426]WGR77106.1 TIGR02594 family protein [Bradyrhizobium sp. ISRA430]WGR87511.1 TIGR02594 family protein [Bradyrhizobium sp. ISRA432]
MLELFAYRLSRLVVALALLFAAAAVFISPASARSHRHHVSRHDYVHHSAHYATRHHRYRHLARGSRFERGAAQLQARGLSDTQASYNPNANSGGMAVSGSLSGGSGLVSEARRYLGGNPTSRGSLWCARFMNMVLEHTGHKGTGSDMASSFAHYGTRVSGPQVGAIAVMSRGGRGGHVGIITGIDAKGNPIMISGNNGNRVREAPVSRGRIYAYVMPN